MKFSRKSKLYRQTSNDFKLPFYVNRKNIVETRDADFIPTLSWPDGRWCLEANIFMLELFDRGLSRSDKGGSLLTYASNLSPIIRFCYYNKIDFINLTDSHFIFFIKSLLGERRAKTPEVKARDTNSVLAIGRKSLEFLYSVGRFHCEDKLIGPDGQIRAEQRSFEILCKRGTKTVTYWHHRAFPTPDPKKSRLPISTSNIAKLRDAILPASRTVFQRKRRYVMLKLLEITGGRRTEVVEITVDSIRQASLMTEPMLKLNTKKRGKVRFIPISLHDLVFLLEFIEKNRSRIVRHTCGIENDDGYLLISETTGLKLQSNTITQEIHLLAKVAMIIVKICPHLFRHRFITKLFVALIEQHNITNPDEFRRALLDLEALKQKVQQCVGVIRLDSLDPYIHMAFDEVTNFKKTYDLVRISNSIDSFRITLHQIVNEIKGGLSFYEAQQLLVKLLNALDLDLEQSKS